MAGDPDPTEDRGEAVPALVAALAARIEADRIAADLLRGEEEDDARQPIPSCPGSLDNLPVGEPVDVDSVRQPGSENGVGVSLNWLCGRLVCEGVGIPDLMPEQKLSGLDSAVALVSILSGGSLGVPDPMPQ